MANMQQMILDMMMGGGQPMQQPTPVNDKLPLGQESMGPKLYESGAFQAAVEEFVRRNGYEPATDSDFEADGGVLQIMQEMSQGQSRGATQQKLLDLINPREDSMGIEHDDEFEE